jgi:EF hand
MLAARRTIHAAAVVFAVVASVSFLPVARAADTAQDKIPASYMALMKMNPMDVMHAMDSDKKGYVMKEDFMKFHDAMFDRMDKNKDGKLTEDEWMGKPKRDTP